MRLWGNFYDSGILPGDGEKCSARKNGKEYGNPDGLELLFLLVVHCAVDTVKNTVKKSVKRS